MAVDADRILSDRQRLACRHAQLPFDEVEAGDHFRNRVLDLQSGVHLEEEEAIRVRHEFHCAGAFVPNGQSRRYSGTSHCGAAIVVETWRGRFLDHLLMAPLDRAVALEQVERIAMPIGEHLHLDVTRVRQVAFEQHMVIAECRRGFLSCLIKCRGELIGVRHDPHAAAAAARHRLDHQREADAVRLIGEERCVLTVAMIPGQQRHTGFLHQRLSGGFGPHGAHRRRRWPDEGDARLRAGVGEVGILGEEAIARMYGIGSRAPCRFHDAADVEVAVARWSLADQHCPVRRLNMQRIGIRR